MTFSLLTVIVLYIAHDIVIKHKDAVKLFSDELDIVIKKMESKSVNVKVKRENLHSLTKLRTVNNLIKESTKKQTIKLSTLLDTALLKQSVIKKELTLEFNNILKSHTTFNDNEIYNLTFIFNRFLGDLFDNPLKAVINLVTRLYRLTKQ